MTAIEFIRKSLEMGQMWIMGLAADMRDQPLVQPTPHGGNHPLWCLGHLAYSEAQMVDVLAQGKPHPFADWQELFDAGTSPSTDAKAYPPFEEVLQKLEQTQAATIDYVNSLTDADLSKPSHAEGEARQWFGTIGDCLAAVPIHLGFHGGQIADARRAAGRGVLMG